jgi:hypothetical protein
MNARTLILTVSIFSVSFLIAEESRKPASPPFADLGWESWVVDLSTHLKEREEKRDETLVHSFFLVGGEAWHLRWLPLRKPERENASMHLGISDIIKVAENFLTKKLPAPMRESFSINGCQKFYLKKNGEYLWLVDLKIHPQFYVRTGLPIRNLISIPIDEAGNLMCEIVQIESSVAPDVLPAR